MGQCSRASEIVAARVDFDVEEILPGTAAHRTAFELGQVDVAQGEDAQRLEERARRARQREHDRRLVGVGRRNAADDREARDVVFEILNGFLQYLEAEDLCGALRGESRRAFQLLLGHQLGAARRVVHGFDGGAESLQIPFTLRERLRMRVDDLDVGDARAGQRLQAMHDVELDLAGDPELVIEQQIVVAVDGAADRVLERHDAVRRPFLDDRFEDVVEGLAGQRLDIGAAEMKRRRFAVGPRFSLIRDSHD